MPDDVTMFGVEEIEARLKELGPKLVRKALSDCLEASGSVLQVAQIEAAPIGDGNAEHPGGQLKQDIRRVVRLQPSEGIGIVAVGPSKHSFYGSFCEFGTSHQPSHPWMRPSFEASSQEALDVFAKVLTAHLTQIVKEK